MIKMLMYYSFLRKILFKNYVMTEINSNVIVNENNNILANSTAIFTE